MSGTPCKISILVPVRRAEHTIERTLSLLLQQALGKPIEVIVAVASEEPTSRLLERMEHPHLRKLISSVPAGVPQLRRDAARAATGDFVILTEDHCLFPPSWAERLVAVLESSVAGVGGGPVGNARLTIVGWAQYFVRYAPYVPPVLSGPVTDLPGNNACYRRHLLAESSAELEHEFWEAELNRRLRASGVPFVMAGDLQVEQNQHRGPGEFFSLRFRHGRCYGARRWQSAGLALRLQLLVRAPLVPAVLWIRALRCLIAKPSSLLRFLAVTPFVVVYFVAWAAGELAGYLTGAGRACQETD